jgi:hypothetical protein
MLKGARPTDRGPDASPACIEDKSHECQLVDFVGQDGRCHSFPLAQIVHCVLEKNPAFQKQTDLPPDRLAIVFPTHDVVVLGWNLKMVRDALDLRRPAVVRARDVRYAEIEDKQAFVTEIIVTAAQSLSKGG